MLPKAYDPQATEDRLYKMWEESGAFCPSGDPDKETFTISMPPPNATGQLHLGHAVMLALEDIFIRYQRMQGKDVLWLPGTDHASIATESVVIKKIQKEEGIKNPREALGREELLKRIREYVEDSRGTIRSQIRKMGASCDWTRENYTLNPALQRTTYEAFKDMYEKEVIYRGHRIVNWDPKLHTTLSDDEVVWKDQKDTFYTFQYGPFQIGTVRPETKFGDKYVVVHPDDERYKDFKHGDTFECEWINGPITATVIKDDAADPEMGTGAMTITPWHSQVDFEIAERHGLDKEQIIDFDGNLLEAAGEFAGMPIADAREKIVEKLDKKGLLVSVKEDYEHTVATSSRGGAMVEPQIKEQWWVDVSKEAVDWKGKKMSLKQIMQDVVRSGDITVIPERFEKNYFYWIDNLRDWCISRQLWWGHRVPVWYKGEEIHVDVQPPEGDGWEQDPDTLDTWYGVGQWTWAPLLDQKLCEDYSLSLQDIMDQSPEYQRFHPTQVLETGYDILFFWVARMILMTTYSTGQIPFETVYLHGLIRTREGKKMSKSDPSTMIDPLDIIPEFGADALRMSMIVGQSPGNDQKLYKEKIGGYRNFINKLWNASRFVLMQCEAAGLQPAEWKMESGEWKMEDLSLADRAILSELQDLIDDVSKGLDAYRLSEVGERLYSFTWDYFCDWYLELSKGNANPQVLVHVLRTLLQLLHPYCPFVTEELWGHLKPADSDMLIHAAWPQSDSAQKDDAAQKDLQVLIDTISAIRSLRADQGIDPGKQIAITLITGSQGLLLEEQNEHIKRLAKVESLTIDTNPDAPRPSNAACTVIKDIEIHIPLEGLVDIEKEVARLTGEKQKLEGFIKGINAKLDNKKFVENANPEVVQLERDKLESAQEKLQRVTALLESLS